jgi:hypothetical protein
MTRNPWSVTMAGMTGHDAETGGHVGPKYALSALKKTAAELDRLLAASSVDAEEVAAESP